ncbi:hypothetical protein OEZ86_005367 [Tetradesmus obliquus]|nr:hypothetical protein OEZ86_005367 [Tetradesmus obliquus]
MSQAAQSATKPGGVNTLLNVPTLVTPQNQAAFNIVAPNCDTRYTTSWLDLTAGPQMLGAPNTNGRYYVMELLDFYTNVFGNPGAPTTGTAASKWVVLPPAYKRSALPRALWNLRMYRSNTTGVWLLGRTYVANQSDLAAAREVQQQYSLSPAMPPPGNATGNSTALTHLQRAVTAANALLQQAVWQLGSVSNSTPAFAAIMGKAFSPSLGTAGPLALAPSLGLSRARGFNQTRLSVRQQAVLQAGSKLGQACITSYASSGDIGVSQASGWSYTTKAGTYGSDYILRAAVALVGVGANEPNITVYGANRRDADMQALNGNQTYSVAFASVPPAEYFSSLTLYSAQTNMLMSNAYSNRSVLNFNATPGLQWNKDGSIDVYLSSKPPGPAGSKQLANWLPAGENEQYWAALRLYGPSYEVVNGSYPLPPIVRVQP